MHWPFRYSSNARCKSVTEQLSAFSDQVSTRLHSSSGALARSSLEGMRYTAQAGIEQLSRLSISRSTNNASVMPAIIRIVENVISTISKHSNVIICKDKVNEVARFKSILEEGKSQLGDAKQSKTLTEQPLNSSFKPN